MPRLECFNCGRHDHSTEDCKLPKHPSKEQAKRAAFIVDDLIDDLEAFTVEADKYWIDGGPMSDVYNRLRSYVKYVRTGETLK